MSLTSSLPKERRYHAMRNSAKSFIALAFCLISYVGRIVETKERWRLLKSRAAIVNLDQGLDWVLRFCGGAIGELTGCLGLLSCTPAERHAEMFCLTVACSFSETRLSRMTIFFAFSIDIDTENWNFCFLTSVA